MITDTVKMELLMMKQLIYDDSMETDEDRSLILTKHDMSQLRGRSEIAIREWFGRQQGRGRRNNVEWQAC